ELKQLILEKKTLHRKYKISSDVNDNLRLSSKRQECKKLAYACYLDYIESVEDNIKLNPRYFFKHINDEKEDRGCRCMRFDGEDSERPEIIAACKVVNVTGENYVFPNSINITSLEVSIDEVLEERVSLQDKTDFGSDKIPALFLK
ncbi:hypothetical protein HHI36_003935, partial [Cryptolaemus montrouzieri]